MVLVRRSELACRTGWDQDLWEPRETVERPPFTVLTSSWSSGNDELSAPREESGVTEATRLSPSRSSVDELAPPLSQHLPSLRSEQTGRSGETEPFPVLESVEGASADTDDTVTMTDEVAPEAQDLLAKLPRICRTCRDFRSTGDGRFGWCQNPFAFAERMLVDGETLACASTLGSWWVPSDDWWLRQVDISHHGQPTPHVDEFLRQLLEERQQNQRRRRASS